MKALAEKPKNAIENAGKTAKGNKQGVDALVDHRPEARTIGAMLHITVYLAEEWRKQGAAKI